MSDASVYPLTLYYESACALCDSEIRNLKLRNHAELLRFVDVSAPDFVAPAGVSPEALLSLMHAQTSEGRWLIGVPVFEAAYRAVGLPGVSRLLQWPGVRQFARYAYPVVARHRHRLPRWLPELVFGTALRRAATRAHQQRCDEGVCARPHQG